MTSLLVVSMELCDLTLKEAHDGLAHEKFSSRELTLSCLQRIDKLEDKLNAFITVTAEPALQQADRVDRQILNGEEIGPLAGVPAGIKDMFCTKGVETTAASNILKGFVPPHDATVVKKLKEAGVVIIGKLNHDAFAHGSSGENSDFGPAKNPWSLEYVPGGSSSGSAAALASGMCLLATGTDTGGSIRLPAAFCNLTGLKPTYGRVSRYGVIAMASSLDCPGGLTRNVHDQALLMNTIAGYDPLDATAAKIPAPDYTKQLAAGVKGLRVGVPREYTVGGIDRAVKESTKEAVRKFERLGAVTEEISLPHTEYGVATYCLICHPEVSSNLARYDGVRFGHSRESFGDEAKRRIMLGTFALSAGYYEAYYNKAQRVRTLIKKDFEEAFKRVDVIVAPSSPTPPFKIGEKMEPLQMYLSDVFLCPVNLAGAPSLDIPCGFVQNLPIGIQIIGPQFSESLLLRVGYAYEQATNYYKKRPPLITND